MTREEEYAVIERVRGGDVDAFEALVTAYQKQIYNLTLRYVSSPEDAADLTQEAFLRAYRSLDSFRGDSRFSVWMYRLTTNICIDFLRSRGRGSAVSSLTVENEDEELEELELPDNRYDPQRELERRELRRAVRAGLDTLSEDAREIVILRELEGLSYAEIGERLGLEAGTVKSRLFRARKALCDYLRESGNIPDGFPSNKKKSGGEKA